MKLMHELPAQSWLADTLAILQDGPQTRELQTLKVFLSRRLQMLDFNDIEATGAELDRLDLEGTWCNSVLQGEFDAWKSDALGGATRRVYSNFVAERRDKGSHLEPKRRWATVIRAPKALRHVATKADAKLLTATRLGDRRSLSNHANPHSQVLGVNCPCCHAAVDSAPHMIQCPVVRADPGVEEAIQQLRSSMYGRPIKVRGGGDREISLLVDFVAAQHLNMGAEKVLLGNCDPRCVPANLRGLYTALHSDRALHALWLKGTVRILRACWAAHDAAVQDGLAAADAGEPPPVPPDPPTRQQRLREWSDLHLPGEPMLPGQADVPGLVAGFHAPMEQAPLGEGEAKEEEDEGAPMEQKVPEAEDALPPLSGLGGLVRSPDPPDARVEAPSPGLPLGLASLLAPPRLRLPPVAAAAAAAADPPAAGFSLMGMLAAAAPRGLMSLLSAGAPDLQDDDDNSPPRAHQSHQQPVAPARADAACPHGAQRDAPCPACCSAASGEGSCGAHGAPS
jgi:hypothetical protein